MHAKHGCVVALAWALCGGSLAPGLATAQAPAAPATATAAPAQAAEKPQATPEQAAAIAERMNAVLQAWSARSREIKSLNAQFTRVDVSHVWQDEVKYEGQAFLESPNLAYLNFEKVGEDGTTKPFERIVCTGDRVFHFLAETKQVHIYNLAQKERERALEEGPLPFLFNMNAEQARSRYQMTLRGEDEKRYLIEILPLQEVDKDAFGKAWIWLDRTQMMPTHIRLFDPSNGKDTQTYTIKTVQPNLEVAASYFDATTQTRQVVQAAQWDVVQYDTAGNQVGEVNGNQAVTPAAASGPAVPAAAAPAPPTSVRQ